MEGIWSRMTTFVRSATLPPRVVRMAFQSPPAMFSQVPPVAGGMLLAAQPAMMESGLTACTTMPEAASPAAVEASE